MSSTVRLAVAVSLLASLAACGGGAATDASGGSAPSSQGAPGTPPAAPPDPGAPPVGTSGSNRFEMGAPGGLYLVDPAQGEPSVQGLVVVTLGPVGAGNFIPPDDTTVTMNGVPLLRDPHLNGAYWRLDPAGPQPTVGSGGRLVLVASGTVGTSRVERTMVLACPSDVTVSSTPAAGSVLALPGAPLHVATTADLTLNVGIPALANVFPTVTLYGFDLATRALAPSGAPKLLPPGPVDVDVPVTPTLAPAYLLDLRWPGPWVVDGETGGFCGLAKRLFFAR